VRDGKEWKIWTKIWRMDAWSECECAVFYTQKRGNMQRTTLSSLSMHVVPPLFSNIMHVPKATNEE